MAIREDLVASAAKFLQDPSVSSSPPESRVAFLKAKNLTPEEISASLARAGLEPAPGYPLPPPPGASPLASHPGQPQPPYFAQPPYGQYPPYGWQPPPEIPRRDWRDWFIMATMVGGVGYGLYSITKRYIYPLVSPPTPDRLEQDKKAIDEQFERAFALVDQLAKDTDELKAAEKDRTERLDAALANLESVLTDLKAANKRREDDAERLRDDVKGLKDALPKAMDAQKDVTDGRLREVNTELKGLKTLINQRMAPAASSSVNGTNIARIGSSSGSSFPVVPTTAAAASVASAESDKAAADKSVAATPAATTATTAAPVTASTTTPSGFTSGYSATNLTSSAGASGSSGSSFSTGVKASIPAWQRAMSKPAASSSTAAGGSSSNAGSGSSTPTTSTAVKSSETSTSATA